MSRAGAIGLLLWAGLGAAGAAPAIHGEVRLRHDSERQTLLRAVAGLEWQLAPAVRVFGELGTGQLGSGRATAGANFQNEVSMQQLFVELSGTYGGAIIGRQEFADGARQLISISDGPNLHRTWNGVRVFAQGGGWRLGAYDLRATKLGRGWFDEDINHAERLRGVNASISVAEGTLLDPFWMQAGQRTTVGARLWRKQGDVRFDWTLARQDGAWAMFAVHSMAVAKQGWKPRMTARVDVASANFHQLYASSSYLGEGQFLSLRNLLMVSPGLSLTPTPRTSVSLEYGFARRLNEGQPAYGGAMRAYAGTRLRDGKDIGTGRHVGSERARDGGAQRRAVHCRRLAAARRPALAQLRLSGGHRALLSERCACGNRRK